MDAEEETEKQTSGHMEMFSSLVNSTGHAGQGDETEDGVWRVPGTP